VILSRDDVPAGYSISAPYESFEHPVEGCQSTDLVVPDVNRHLLEYTKHGSFAHRAVLTLKGVVLGEILNSGLKECKLVGDEWIAIDEVIPIIEIAIGLRAVGKVEQGLKIIGLRVMKVGEQVYAFLGLCEQSFLDDLCDIGTGELHPGGEPRLDRSKKSFALLFTHFADDHSMSSCAVTMIQARHGIWWPNFRRWSGGLVINFTFSAIY
jgi:hypothetical protein